MYVFHIALIKYCLQRQRQSSQFLLFPGGVRSILMSVSRFVCFFWRPVYLSDRIYQKLHLAEIRKIFSVHITRGREVVLL